LRYANEWSVGKEFEGDGRGLFAGIIHEEIEENHAKLW
jgi:hypothetical protein